MNSFFQVWTANWPSRAHKNPLPPIPSMGTFRSLWTFLWGRYHARSTERISSYECHRSHPIITRSFTDRENFVEIIFSLRSPYFLSGVKRSEWRASASDLSCFVDNWEER